MLDQEYEITPEELTEAKQAASEPEPEPAEQSAPTPEAQPAEGQVEQQVESSVESEPQGEDLPEKFRGKSAADIAKAYAEAEKRLHEIASERSFERKRAEEYETRLRELEASRQQQQADPFEEIEKLWEVDPKEAVKKVYQKAREEREQLMTQRELQDRARSAEEFYHKAKTDNPDFAQREVEMVELGKKFGQLFNPRYANSKETLELLYLAARGAKVDEYSKTAIEKATKQQQLIKEEKRKAASETSVSKGDVQSFSEVDDFHSMSPQQQREELRKMRQALK